MFWPNKKSYLGCLSSGEIETQTDRCVGISAIERRLFGDSMFLSLAARVPKQTWPQSGVRRQVSLDYQPREKIHISAVFHPADWKHILVDALTSQLSNDCRSIIVSFLVWPLERLNGHDLIIAGAGYLPTFYGGYLGRITPYPFRNDIKMLPTFSSIDWGELGVNFTQIEKRNQLPKWTGRKIRTGIDSGKYANKIFL